MLNLKDAAKIVLTNICKDADECDDCDRCQEAQTILKNYAQTGLYDCDECAYMYIRGDEICCSRDDGGKECEFAEIEIDEEDK